MRLSSFLATLTATGMAMAAPTASKPSGNFKDEMLAAHNFFRDQHGADPLSWDEGLASKAQKWAEGCKFEHSGSGENLASHTGPDTWGSFVNMWGSERRKYSWANPSFSSSTGHFTQVVWKGTKTVGCGQYSCGGGGQGRAGGFYVVCNYDPPGNYNNDYTQNVGKQIKGKPEDVWKAGVEPGKEPGKEPGEECEDDEGDQDGDQESMLGPGLGPGGGPGQPGWFQHWKQHWYQLWNQEFAHGQNSLVFKKESI